MSWSVIAVKETDAELRDRLRYVAGEAPGILHEIERASDEKLEDLASRFNLKRRRV